MPAYVIAEMTVTDPVAYKEYVEAAPPVVAQYGGKFLARGGQREVLEGEWRPDRLVVLEFPSLEQARAFYGSPEYAAAIEKRKHAARFNMVVVDGLG